MFTLNLNICPGGLFINDFNKLSVEEILCILHKKEYAEVFPSLWQLSHKEFSSVQNIIVKFKFIIRNTTIQPCLRECNYTRIIVGKPSSHEIYFSGESSQCLVK